MDAATIREDVQQASEKLRDNLAEGIGRVQGKVEENVRRGMDQTRGVLTALNEQFGSLVHESPIIALGGAFAVGYLAAKIARAFK